HAGATNEEDGIAFARHAIGEPNAVHRDARHCHEVLPVERCTAPTMPEHAHGGKATQIYITTASDPSRTASLLAPPAGVWRQSRTVSRVDVLGQLPPHRREAQFAAALART